MQARYYDPVIGRFYSNDPVGYTGNAHSFNRYAYANNNPYRYTDPDGQYPESLNEWVNFTVGVGKMASAGLQVVLGGGAIAAGIADIAAGSKIVGVGLISYGTYSVVDSQYTAKDAGNRISDAWNNETGKNKHNVPEGIVEHIAQAADCSANCQSIAKTTDQVLGVASGNVVGTATKGNAILDTVSSFTDKLDKADGIIKNLDKVNQKR